MNVSFLLLASRIKCKRQNNSVRNLQLWKGEGHFASFRVFFSSFAGGLRFVNFELGQWNFTCHQPYTKSIFQVIIWTFKNLYDAREINLQMQDK